MGGLISEQVGLGYIRNQASKPINNVPLWSLLHFLIPGSILSSSPGLPPLCDNELNWNLSGRRVLFLPQLVFGHCFITATGKQTRIQGLLFAWNLPNRLYWLIREP